MSHRTGKIEICGIDDRHIFLQYHRAHRKEDFGRMLVAARDDDAYWFDQLRLVSGGAERREDERRWRTTGERVRE